MNKILLILLTLSMATIHAFAFSTSQTTVNSQPKVLSIKAKMNECINVAESKEAIHRCIETYTRNDCINTAESKEDIHHCLKTSKMDDSLQVSKLN